MEGIGPEAVRCAECGAEGNPFRVSNGYTVIFDEERQVAVTVGPAVSEELARDAAKVMALPEASAQNPVVALCPADIAGVITRLRPFIGHVGTTPAIDMPDSHNAGDFAQMLVDAPHEYGITKEQLEARTDGHMDVDSVREGAILVCPVKVPGGGVYVGDVHAMQGDGEIAGHTTDVSAEVTLQVSVLKGLEVGGPILLPPLDDVPYLARPLSATQRGGGCGKTIASGSGAQGGPHKWGQATAQAPHMGVDLDQSPLPHPFSTASEEQQGVWPRSTGRGLWKKPLLSKW